MKKLIISLAILITLFFTFYFIFRPTYLDNLPYTELTFSELPIKVSEEYSKITREDLFSNHSETEAISLNSKYKIAHEHTGIDDGVIVLIYKGFYHHFYINDQHFKLRANKGKPFIFANNKLYYSTNLNMTKQDLHKSIFIQIDLSKKLD